MGVDFISQFKCFHKSLEGALLLRQEAHESLQMIFLAQSR